MNETVESAVTKIHLEALSKIVGSDYVFTDNESLNDYGHDETEKIVCPPESLMKRWKQFLNYLFDMRGKFSLLIMPGKKQNCGNYAAAWRKP